MMAGILWFDQVVADGDDLAPRPALDGGAEADVAIVGAGFTGLWTAYHLVRAEPGLRVVVVERQIAGFGASGRNGGWCSALFPASPAGLARRHGRAAALAMGAAMRDTVDEVGKAVVEEDIACDWVKGGTVALARTPAQLRRARAEGGFLGAGGRRRWSGPPGCSGRPTRRTVRGSSPPGSYAGSRGPSSGGA
jgi:glycine/D-amino acid oxidase-like deaminating enzyme